MACAYDGAPGVFAVTAGVAARWPGTRRTRGTNRWKEGVSAPPCKGRTSGSPGPGRGLGTGAGGLPAARTLFPAGLHPGAGHPGDRQPDPQRVLRGEQLQPERRAGDQRPRVADLPRPGARLGGVARTRPAGGLRRFAHAPALVRRAAGSVAGRGVARRRPGRAVERCLVPRRRRPAGWLPLLHPSRAPRRPRRDRPQQPGDQRQLYGRPRPPDRGQPHRRLQPGAGVDRPAPRARPGGGGGGYPRLRGVALPAGAPRPAREDERAAAR